MHQESISNKLVNRQSSEEMDKARKDTCAYEYLCRLEEAKIWMESVLKEPLPLAVNLEENLRNGVYLAKLGNFIAPEKVPLSRIYDIFQHRYKSNGLQFRHTDNINYWLEALKAIDFPKMFLVETTDVYDKKNMPKVIYCIHALSSHLFHLGQAPLIKDLFGKVEFSKQEIDTVSLEIEKSGVSIPAFQKIGGLLSKELTRDLPFLNSDLINLNKAIDEGSEELLIHGLNLPSVRIAQVIPEYITHYMTALRLAKDEKSQASHNRSLNKSYEPDPFDELLSLSEIQGYIRKVNIDCVWQDVLKSIKKKKRENLKEIITSSFTEIKDYNQQNIEHYIDVAISLDLDNLRSNNRDALQTIVRDGNRRAKDLMRVSDAVSKVKQAIVSRNKESLLIALRAPSLKLSSQISDFAAPLYLEEMGEDLKMSNDLNYKDIRSSIFVLNDIAKITSAVDSRDCGATWMELSNSDIPFMNIDSALKTQYFKELHACRQQKLKEKLPNCLLTFVDVQECIDAANLEEFQRTQALIHIEEVNESVRERDLKKLSAALQGLLPGEISKDDLPLCMQLLNNLLARKQEISGEELWLDDIKHVAKEVQGYNDKALEVCNLLYKMNCRIASPQNVLKSIENYGNCGKKNTSASDLRKSGRSHVWSPDTWLMYKLTADITIYVNTAKQVFKWSKPNPSKEDKLHFITVDDLALSDKNICNSLSEIHSEKKFALTEQSIIQFQASIRGFVVRSKIKNFMNAVITIQRWWRKVAENRKLALDSQPESSPYDLNHYRNNIDKITKIQALWRGCLSRKNFPIRRKKPQIQVDPSFQLLRHLALVRQINSHDYSTDLKVQMMKSCVVETIKVNQELARKLEEMDMKIGLLVQNRISVESIVAENKKLQNVHHNGNDSRGIKAFSKEAKRLLDGYQQLFYLLQTDPAYLTRLIVRLPSRLNHVIQSCVLSLFNYGSNSRDAYLLLRLFRSALYEEVNCKFQKPVDAVTGNPLVLRMAVAFARQVEGHNPLRNILGFLIEKVLNDKMFIDTNPVDIYRRWVNQIETESGKPSELPQTVTQEEALSYPEVVARLNHNLRILQSWVKCFLDRLTQCVNQFPYALRYIAKLLKNALLQKFPQTPEKDILKIVGNLVYYQYINSAIVAPDAFFTVSLPPDQPMKVEQRRNLASIAKILHFAATKKGFGEESKYLMCLNPFIIECHKDMKKFCQNCCAVEDLEEHYHVTKYSEAALIDKPRVYMSLEEIRECHKLLLEVREEIAPDCEDPVHVILDDLGPPPSLAILVGCSNSSEATLSRAGKIQVCLELDNKFQSPPEEVSEDERLFIKTKELITSRLHELNGETLGVAIRNPKHADIAANLAKLESAGLVRSGDDYQDIVRSLIRDVSHKHEYRKLQDQEIHVLKIAQQRLNEKRNFYEEQVARYEQYLKTCLNNLTVPYSNKLKQKKERSVKYSGTRLREKGVLISLDGVPHGQLKNVQFEISTTKLKGIYSIHGRFMGIEVEKIDIDIQELLKLQFEGLREMDLFGKAQINVNLLLHLLNKKFHART